MAAFWYFAFSVAKAVELGGTAFIVLRKQKLIFLHWYHHVITFISTWYACCYSLGVAPWIVTTNIGVHAIMYTYYAFKAMKYRVPVFVSMFITSVQFIQMVLGVYAMYLGYGMTLTNQSCQLTSREALWYFGVYFSFLFLFGHFFYKTYIEGRQLRKFKSS